MTPDPPPNPAGQDVPPSDRHLPGEEFLRFGQEMERFGCEMTHSPIPPPFQEAAGPPFSSPPRWSCPPSLEMPDGPASRQQQNEANAAAGGAAYVHCLNAADRLMEAVESEMEEAEAQAEAPWDLKREREVKDDLSMLLVMEALEQQIEQSTIPGFVTPYEEEEGPQEVLSAETPGPPPSPTPPSPEILNPPSRFTPHFRGGLPAPAVGGGRRKPVPPPKFRLKRISFQGRPDDGARRCCKAKCPACPMRKGCPRARVQDPEEKEEERRPT